MAYVIDLQLRGASQIVQQANQVAAALRNVGAAMPGASGGSRSGGGGSSSSPGGLAVGPYQRFAASQINLIQALRSGNWAQQQDAMILYHRSLKAVQAAQKAAASGNNNFAKSLMNLIYSTRVGVGPNGVTAMPLIGKTLDFIGKALMELPPEISGPIIIAFAGYVAATLAAIQAVQAGMQLTKAYFAGGGTMKQTGQLAGVAAILGISPEQAAGMARGLNQGLMNNPYARSFAAQNGVTPNYVGAYGDINDTQRFLKLFDKIISPKISDDTARRAAMGTPLESALWLRNADPNAIKGYRSVIGDNANPMAIREAATAQVLWNTAMARFGQLAAKIGSIFLPAINWGLEQIVKGLEMWQMAMYYATLWFVKIINWFRELLHMTPIKEPEKPDFSSDKDKSLKDNTDALNNLARALNNERQTYGGGANARNALPKNYFAPGIDGSNASQRASVNMGMIPVG